MMHLLLALLSLPAVAATPSYSLQATIPIAVDGGWDYLAVDQASHRLFVSHGDRVMVISTETNQVVGELDGTPGVHGIAFADDLGRAFTSNGGEGKIGIFDLKTLAPIGKADAGSNPDAIAYDSAEQEVYAFNGKSGTATVADARSGKVLATIALPGKPEFAAVDTALHRVFVNMEDKNTLVAIDTVAHKVVANWAIAPGDSASGLTIDQARHRLLLGCHNKLMLVVDATNGKVLDQVAIGSGVDSVWYDATLNLAYSSNGEGSVTIASLAGDAKFSPVQTLVTKPKSRTMALDYATHWIYVPTADFKAGNGPNAKPAPVPGTFKVLVYGTAAE